MLRDMSSLRIFRRNSQKHVPQEQIENASENPAESNLISTAMAGSTRAPLSPISEPAQKSAGVATENLSGSRRCDGTPTKPKGKGHVRGDDSEIPPFTSPLKHGLVPPAPTGNANNRNRFGWPQRYDGSFRETNVANGRRSPIIRDNPSESPGDMSFTPRSLTYAAGNEANHGNGNALQSNRGFVVGNGGSNQATPRPIKTSRASSTQSECSSTSSTPTKSVSRQGNSGASAGTALNGFRFPAAQNSGARSGHTSKNMCMTSTTPTVVNTIEVPHFELKEDPAFWMDHNVQVFVRIRPLNSSEVASQGYNRCLKQESAQTLTFLGPPETRFTFDHVACETITQEMLFKVAGFPMVENCMSGYNSCMFAYGQTGSGKTHTMLGDIDELDQRPSINRGMTPRIFEYLFARIRAEEESHIQERLKYACKCSFLEIYNEQISDLLEPSSSNLQLREDVRKGVYVENLTEVEVRSVQDIVRLLLLGAANRKVAATNMNRESSRSHSVFTCVIESHWEKDSMTNIRYGRLNLVDLAGSERQKSSGAEGERLKEAANINKSLSTLGLVIMILVDVAQGKQRHIPYRDSRLTFLLQDSLGGNSKTTIIANISPSLCSANETMSTLKFAQRAKFIQNNAIINEGASGDVMALRLQIQQLKEELSFFKRQNVSRSLSFRSTIFSEMKPSDGEGNMTFVPINNLKFPESSLDLLPSSNALCSPKISNKKLKSLEATLAGALRREQVAENTTKRLEAEIEQLNRLVRQREEDTQCSKMMLRFREDKIRRLESVTDGLLSSDAYLLEEKNALAEELQLIRGRLDRNPELTRFAMENIRLLEQLRKYQDFYEGGEREVLVAEVSDLREQLLEVLEGKFEQDKNPCALSTPQDILTPEFACIVRENQMLKSEVDNTRKEIEDCRIHLSACLESNEKMSREIDELHVQLEELKAAGFLQQKELETLRSQYSGGDTVERENGHEQSITYLKSQLQMDMELQAKIDLQEKTQREQELEMRHSEEIMQLQLEIESIETVLEEERSYRKEAEERVLQLNQELEAATEKSLQFSKDLEAALAKFNEGKSVIEALESQQLFSINEMENLQLQNREMLELLNKKEEERNLLEMNNKLLHEQLIGTKEVHMVEKQRKDQCTEDAYGEHSLLQIKLERMQNALEKARRLNMKLQNEQASHTSHEEEKDQVRRQAESETAEVIICLQEELVALREQVDSTTSKESEASECLRHLKGEVGDLQDKLKYLTEENDRLVSMMVRKDDEIKNLKDEWEKAASDLANFLAEGDQALEDASEQMENIMDLFPERRLKIENGVERVVAILAEKERVIDVLQKQLQHAHKLARETEGKIRSLKEATVAITEVQRQENDEISKEASKMRSELSHKLSVIQSLENKVANYQIGIHEAEKRASAAFIMVKKLTEMNEAQTEVANCVAIELEEAFEARCCQKDNLVQDLQKKVLEARLQIDSLKKQIQKSEEERHELKQFLANEQDKVKAAEKNVQVKAKDIRMMEDQVEKSWQKAFEMESNLYLYFGAMERELSANKVDSITHFKTLQRQVQDQYEEMHTLKDDLMYHVGYQTEMIQKSIKDSRDKENTVVLAFADSVLCAKTIQHRNDKIMCQLRESESSLRSARDKLKTMEIELQEKDQKVQELTAALQALEVVKSNVEIEKKQLILLADQASSRCSTKEQELHGVQKELACILAKLKELEGKADSVNSRIEEPVKQLKDLQEERSKFLADLDSQKVKLDNEGEGPQDGIKDVEGQVMTKQVAVIDELAVMQCNLGVTQTKMVDLTLTDVPMLEKSGWEYEKEILLEDLGNASVMVSDKKKDLSSLHNSLAEVQEKLKVTEDKLGALVALINDFASSEDHLRNERNGLSSKLELLQAVLLEKEKQVEVLRNQQVGQISEAVPKSIVIQDFDNVTFMSEHDRMKFESLRTSIFEKDQTILSVRKEMEAALASLKEAEVEMNRTLDEKEELHKSFEEGRQKNEYLTNEVKNSHEEINHKEREIELLQSEMVKMLDSMEQRMKEAEAGWWKEKEILSLELNDAKLIASEKSSEAVSVLRKFEESQETIREADLMLNALLRANENAKCDTERWKNVEEELVSERGSLIDEVERAKIAFAEKEQQVVLMHEQIQRDSQVIRDLISVVEESVINYIKGLQEEFKTINTEIGSLKLDFQSALDSPRTWFEEMWSMVAERNNTMSLLHASRVQELMGKLQTLYTQVGFLDKKLTISNESVSQLEKNNMHLHEEIDKRINLGARLEANIVDKETQIERLLGQLSDMERKMSDLEVQEDLMTKWSTAKDFELAALITDVEQMCNDLEATSSELKKMETEKEELSLQLEQSRNKIACLEQEQESIHLEIDSLNMQLHESNKRVCQLEKCNMDLNNEVKQYETALTELHEDLKYGPERAFQSVEVRENLAGLLQSFKMEISDLKMKEKILRKEMMDKESQVEILRQEVDAHAKVQSHLEEMIQLVEDLQREKQELYFESEKSFKMISQLENEKASFQLEEDRLKERLKALNLEIHHNSESLAQFQKLSAAADDKLKKRDEVIEVLHKKLEEASVNSSCMEQERKELQDKGCMLDNSLAALQSDFDLKNKVLIELQLSYSKVLEELELKNQEIEVLMNKLNASEMDNMELRNSICKEIETKENLCSELQQNNHIAAELKMEHSKSAELLQAREAEVMMLTQNKEYISNKLQRVENENRELNETIKIQSKQFQEFTKQVKNLTEQLNNNSHSSLQVAEKLEARLNSLQESFLSAVSMESADEMQVVYIENILQYTSVLEEKTCAFLAQTELLEMNYKDLMFQKASLSIELERREEILNGLQFDLSLLQESASKAKDQKDEVQETAAALNDELRRVMCHNDHLETKLMEKENELNSLNTELEELKETVASVSHENSQLASDVEDLLTRKNSVEEELEEKQKIIDGLEEELLEMSSLVNQQMIHSIESMKREIKNVTRERDRLQAEVLVLNEQLEMAQAFADEREAIAVEARQVAEARKTYAEEKEEETKLLERSVEELERTVNALESQVDIVKLEAERQRLMKEDLELELQSLRHQMITMQSTHTSVNSQTSTNSFESVTENQRPIMQFELHEASERIQILEKETEEKEIEIKKCKAHIAELIMNAETQANEYQQKYKALEAMANQVKAEQLNPNAITSSMNKSGEKTVVRSRGSGSPFKCIGLGLTQQMNSERDEELHASRRRIEELENFLAARQKEIFMLNSRLAAAESMTHDVIRDLLGVKLDMTNYASVLDNQQVQKIAEKARRQNEESQEKEQEVLKLKHQLNDLIEERESWLDEINRRQAEMVAARVAAEKLRQRDQFLTTENEMLKTDNANQKRRLVELEDEVKKLSGQQNLQQRIHHHAKIKEENNALRVQHEELAAKLRRTEVLLARVSDELAQYRAAEGRSPYISVDEEQRLRNKLQETEEERVQMAQKLLGLCNGILQAAGIIRPPRDIDPSLAVETLQQLKERLECTERELRELKLKTKIASEKMKLSELRQLSNSPLSVKANDKSFASVQQSCSSPANSNLR